MRINQACIKEMIRQHQYLPWHLIDDFRPVGRIDITNLPAEERKCPVSRRVAPQALDTRDSVSSVH